jgi:hypothetical protein
VRDALLKIFSDYGKNRYTCGMFVASLLHSIEKESEIDEIRDILKDQAAFLRLTGVRASLYPDDYLYDLFTEAIYTPLNRRHTLCSLNQKEIGAPLSEEAIRLWIGRQRSSSGAG